MFQKLGEEIGIDLKDIEGLELKGQVNLFDCLVFIWEFVVQIGEVVQFKIILEEFFNNEDDCLVVKQIFFLGSGFFVMGRYREVGQFCVWLGWQWGWQQRRRFFLVLMIFRFSLNILCFRILEGFFIGI